MKELSIQSQNDIIKLSDGSAWVELLDLQLPNGFIPREEYADFIADNGGSYHVLLTNAAKPARENYDINWQTHGFESGKIFLGVPFRREDIGELQGSDGAQTLNLSIGDTSGRLWEFSKDADGFRGLSVSLSVAQVRSETQDEFLVYSPEISVEYVVRYSATDRTNFSFFLSTSAPFSRQYPQRRMFKAQCRWVFKSPECGYTGNATSCARTIAACRALGNIQRIGCFPGCGTGGLAQ